MLNLVGTPEQIKSNHPQLMILHRMHIYIYAGHMQTITSIHARDQTLVNNWNF